MELFKHQKSTVEFILRRGGSGAIFHEPGCGKTLTTLEIFRELKAHNPTLRLLVVCPLSLINSAWGEDVAKFTTFSCSPYKEGKDADIIAVNYETLISKRHLPEIQKMLRSGVWMCAVDESSRMKNFKSLTTKTLLQLAPLFKARVVLSGTPSPNSEQELWAQIRFVSEALPPSFFQFRNGYFHLARGGQTMSQPTGKLDRATMQALFMRGWKYAITKEKRRELMERIAPVCSWVKKEDALDLPEQIDQIREVALSDAERKAYKEMEKFLVVELEDETITATAALAKVMKLRQLSSGFAYNPLRKAVVFGHSKLDELLDVLEELGSQQVIVWFQFKAEVEQIKERLDALGKSYSQLYSEVPNRDENIKRFQEGAAQYLLAHPRSAGHGLTFTNCSTQIFYSLDYSYEGYEQARNRTHRIGQQRACLYVHLLGSATIDRAILNVVKRKATLMELVSSYARKLPKAAMLELSQDLVPRRVGGESIGHGDIWDS